MSASGLPSKPVLWIGRIISALPVGMLFFSATMGFMKPPQVLQEFHRMGFSNEQLIFNLAIVQLCCALLYAIPQTAVLGAILITGYLGGATVTHLRLGEKQWVFPVFLGVLAWLGLVLRDKRLRQLLPFRM